MSVITNHKGPSEQGLVQVLLPLVPTRHWSAGKRLDFKGSALFTSVLPLFLQTMLCFTGILLGNNCQLHCGD